MKNYGLNNKSLTKLQKSELNSKCFVASFGEYLSNLGHFFIWYNNIGFCPNNFESNSLQNKEQCLFTLIEKPYRFFPDIFFCKQ